MTNITFSQDEFNRRPIAEKIIKILNSDIDVAPLLLDGGWGTGKTTFCKKTIALIEELEANEEIKSKIIYVDAFKTDHTGEPLLALLAEIIKVCEPNNETINKLGMIAGSLLRTSAKAIISHVLKVNTDDIPESISDALEDVSNNAIDNGIAHLLKEQSKSEEYINKLKEILSNMASGHKIIIFIDELDRCRPDYALDMLEVVKHIFDLQNVKIILVTNSEQLRAMINHRYGEKVDSHQYLDKFIKIKIILPKEIIEQRYGDKKIASYTYFLNLLRENSLSHPLKINEQESDRTVNLIHNLVRYNNITLRNIESIVRILKLCYIFSEREMDDSREIEGVFYIFISFLYIINPNLFLQIKNNIADADDIASFLLIEKNSLQIDEYVDYKNLLFLICLSKCNKNKEKYILPNFSSYNWDRYRHYFMGRFDYELNILEQRKRSTDKLKIFDEIFDVLALYS